MMNVLPGRRASGTSGHSRRMGLRYIAACSLAAVALLGAVACGAGHNPNPSGDYGIKQLRADGVTLAMQEAYASGGVRTYKQMGELWTGGVSPSLNADFTYYSTLSPPERVQAVADGIAPLEADHFEDAGIDD